MALCHFTHIVEKFRSCGSRLISIHFAKMSTEAVLNPPHQTVRRHKAERGQSDSLAKGLARKSCQQRLMFHLALTTLKMKHDRQPKCGAAHLESIWELRQKDCLTPETKVSLGIIVKGSVRKK